MTTFAEVVRGLGPRWWYRMNEGSGSVMHDQSGNGYDGTFSGAGITYGVTGSLKDEADTAITMDAASDGSSSAAGTDITGAAITVLAVMRASGVANFRYIVAHTDGDHLGYALYTGSEFMMKFYFGDGVTAHLSDPLDVSPWDGLEHVVGATYDGAQIRLYLDGVNRVTTPVATSIASAPQSLHINSFDGTQLWLGATYDEVVGFASVLTPQQMRDVYLSALVGLGPHAPVGAS